MHFSEQIMSLHKNLCNVTNIKRLISTCKLKSAVIE